MKLANDIQRCTGHSMKGKPCYLRNQCARYIQRGNGDPQRTPTGCAPVIPASCDIRIPSEEKAT